MLPGNSNVQNYRNRGFYRNWLGNMVGIMTLPPEVEIVKERSSRLVKDVGMFAFALELSKGRKRWDGR